MTLLTRRDLLVSAGAAGAAMALGSRAFAQAPGSVRPNVLVLKADEHNPLVSSVHGHPFVRTPNMDRLARMGTVYENACCPSPLCCPSRSSYMSGRRAHDIGVLGNWLPGPMDLPSYGSVLAAQGIHTVHIGWCDSFNAPERLGFSEMHGYGFRAHGDLAICRHPVAVREDAAARQHGHGVRPDPFRADREHVDMAVDWIRTCGASLGKPWTLEVNVMPPHFPQYATQKLWDLYEGHDDLPEHGFDCEPARHPFALDLQEHFQTRQFTEESIRGLRRGYYAGVSWVDAMLGRLVAALEQQGLLGNTIVAFTSDHGEMLGKYGLWWKSSMYEDSVRVPLIVAGPGFAAGARVRTPVEQHDFQAAIFRALGAERPAGWLGTPLQDIAPDDPDRAAFSEYHGHGTRASSFMVRTARWKYIHHCGAEPQLFDMDSPDGELRNLAAALPDVARRMDERLRALCDPERENARAEAAIVAALEAAGA